MSRYLATLVLRAIVFGMGGAIITTGLFFAISSAANVSPELLSETLVWIYAVGGFLLAVAFRFYYDMTRSLGGV